MKNIILNTNICLISLEHSKINNKLILYTNILYTKGLLDNVLLSINLKLIFFKLILQALQHYSVAILSATFSNGF